ncbi:MAG: apolipoprotein N-acyltransferase [Saprospiraceae bacterium]|nr:apolipoprotein N-acyltransferase [Candidatus Opimibacter skivensis]
MKNGEEIKLARPWIRVAAIVPLLLAGSYSAWQMLKLPLWGWWPLVLILSFWMAGVLLLYPKDIIQQKWLGAATLSGVFLGLGFPPSMLTWLVFFAWIPLLHMEHSIFQQYQKVKPGKVWLYSYHAFVLWNVISTFWVMNTALIAGIVANFLNAALMATVMVLIHVVRHQLKPVWSIFIFISFWISFEYVHHFWDISWPWLAHGNALSQYPWAIQWYEYIGAFGGSLWVLLVNYTGYKLHAGWSDRKAKQIIIYGSLVLIPIIFSLWIWTTIEEGSADPVSVTVVQPNFEPHYEKFEIPQREQSMRFLKLSFDHIDSTTRYLVFPETSFESIRLNTFRENPVINLFQSVVDSFSNLRLVTGISSFRVLEKDQLKDITYRTHVGSRGDTTFWDIQNSAVQLTSGEQDYQVYFKSKLVPGPEMFPFKEFLFFLEPIVDKLGGSYEGHTKQAERSVFTGGPLNVAPIICYESIYGDFVGGYVRKGATALFIVTNDGWWDLTPGHIQHLKLGTLRAIEHRRPIARSANTGISCFIDIRGRIIQPTKYGETVAIQGEVIPETRITFYTKWGDLVAKFASLISAVIFLAFIFSFGRRKFNL